MEHLCLIALVASCQQYDNLTSITGSHLRTKHVMKLSSQIQVLVEDKWNDRTRFSGSGSEIILKAKSNNCFEIN